MPTYVYRREDGSTFEIEQRITADPLTECPDTGQSVSRVISGGTGIIFKGSGFYITDYERNGNGSASASSSSTDADSSSTTTNGSDTATSSSDNSSSTPPSTKDPS